MGIVKRGIVKMGWWVSLKFVIPSVARNLSSICLERPTDQRVSEMLRFAQHDIGLESMNFVVN